MSNYDNEIGSKRNINFNTLYQGGELCRDKQRQKIRNRDNKNLPRQ